MSRCRSSSGSAGWRLRPKKVLQGRREQIAEFGRTVRPLIRHIAPVMAEIVEIELERAIGHQTNDLAHGVQIDRPAIGREAHHLVFVAVVRKAEILGQRLIEDAERMREVHAAVDRERAPSPHAPGCAGEVAEAVDRNDDRLIEGRHVKGGGKMREMMFDIVERAPKACPGMALAKSSGMPSRLRRFLSRSSTSAIFGRWVRR